MHQNGSKQQFLLQDNYCSLPIIEFEILIFISLLPGSGTAPELHTALKHTLHTAVVQVTTATAVVGKAGEDAEEPDTSIRV